MNPDNKTILDNERTEELPAQERVAVGGEPGLALSADQVYAQRLAETQLNGDSSTHTFIP